MRQLLAILTATFISTVLLVYPAKAVELQRVTQARIYPGDRIALQHIENEKYWCTDENDFYITAENISPNSDKCKYDVTILDSNVEERTVALKSVSRNQYLSGYGYDSIRFIAAAKDKLDSFCKFKLIPFGNNVIITGQKTEYLSGYGYEKKRHIAEVKELPDKFTHFIIYREECN